MTLQHKHDHTQHHSNSVKISYIDSSRLTLYMTLKENKRYI